MKEEKIMSFETWFDKYKPILNPLAGNKKVFEEDDYQIHWGTMEENDFLHDNKGENTIWTVIEGERNSLYLKSGYHRVNRLYHYITQVSYTEEIEIELFEGYPEITKDDLNNLESIKNYMISRDEPKYMNTLEKVIEYVKRTNG